MPSVLDFNRKLDKAMYGENIKEAEKLLDEAGWKKGPDGFRYKDGKKLAPLIYGISGAFKEIAEAVQGDLRKVGIDLQIQLFDSTVAWGKLATQEFDAFGMSFPYVSRRRRAQPLLPLGQHADAQPHELEGQGDRRAARQGLDGDSTTRRARPPTQAVQQKVHDAVVWIPLYHEPLFVVSRRQAQAHQGARQLRLRPLQGPRHRAASKPRQTASERSETSMTDDQDRRPRPRRGVGRGRTAARLSRRTPTSSSRATRSSMSDRAMPARSTRRSTARG